MACEAHPFLFISNYNQLLSTCPFLNSFSHSLAHSTNLYFVPTMRQALCWGRRRRKASPGFHGAHTSVREKDVNQRILVSKCNTVAKRSAVKEKGGGCCEPCDEGRGELGLGSEGGGGAEKQIVTRAEDAIWCKNREKGEQESNYGGLVGIILNGVVTCSDLDFDTISLHSKELCAPKY